MAALCVLTSCGSAEREPAEFLSSKYGASSAPSYLARMGVERENVIVARGDVRRQVVTGPNGKQYKLRWRKVSRSVGRPGAGRLVAGARMPLTGAGFVHNGRHSFGTDETVAYVRYAAWVITQMYPGTVPIVVRDLSAESGGFLPPHKSHRSGRDADIGYYQRGNKPLRGFKTLGPQLDLDKSWTFIEALLRTGAVQYIFVDRGIQKRLRDHAASQGWDATTLEQLFQHPRGSRRAVIRHARGHKNHLHVRFRCPPEDDDCQS